MISKMHDVKSKNKEALLYHRKDFMTEKEIKKLMEEIIRETNISELCSKEGIDANSFFKWSKDFINITRSKLVNNNSNEVSNEIMQLKNENIILTRLVVELNEEVQVLKKRMENLN